jgi:hypothetical protein
MTTATVFGPTYHKINSAFKRDTSIPGNPVIQFEWSQPEFSYLEMTPWLWTEKIDGTNIRLHWDGTKVVLGGRTDNAQIPAKITEAIRNMGLLDPEPWAKKWPLTDEAHPERSNPSVTLYGEGYGPTVQKGGGLYREDVSFILFDVRVGTFWLSRENMLNVAEGFGIDTVPVFDDALSPVLMWDRIRQYGIKSCMFPQAPLEGVVGTPVVPLLSRNGSRVIMKMKQRDWDEYAKVHNVR